MIIRRAILVLALSAGLLAAAPCGAGERSGVVTFTIDVSAPADARIVKLWFPYPTSDQNQTIEKLTFDGNYSRFSISREPRSGAVYLYTEWTRPQSGRSVKVAFRAHAKEQRSRKLVETRDPFPAEARKYLGSDFWVPSNDRKVRELAAGIAAGKATVLAKARAVYDWTVANTRRNPDIPGCGMGVVEATLASRSGKCADISSVFVALARAAGVPAREVFGLRLGKTGEWDLSRKHHCWVEFYLPGTGWVPADPADVVALALRKDIAPADLRVYQDYYFGNVDEYRIALQRGGRGLTFSEGNAEQVNYFMYPYCEVDGRPLDYCRPETFRYTIAFREG